MWKGTFYPLLTDHSSHISLLICVQTSETAHTRLKERFQRDNEALGGVSKHGGEESIPGGARQNLCAWVLLGLKKPLQSF